jgi:hypothetical protein
MAAIQVKINCTTLANFNVLHTITDRNYIATEFVTHNPWSRTTKNTSAHCNQGQTNSCGTDFHNCFTGSWLRVKAFF